MLWLFVGGVAAFAVQGSVPDCDVKWLPSVFARLEDLNDHSITTQHLSAPGNFTFPDIHAGEYLVSIDSPVFAFDYRYKVSVSEDGVKANKLLHGHKVSDTGPEEAHPLEFIGFRRLKTIIDRPSFSFWGLIKQPMVFMGVLTMVLMLGLPYLMSMMDEETLAEVQKVNSARLKGKSNIAIAKEIADEYTKKRNEKAD